MQQTSRSQVSFTLLFVVTRTAALMVPFWEWMQATSMFSCGGWSARVMDQLCVTAVLIITADHVWYKIKLAPLVGVEQIWILNIGNFQAGWWDLWKFGFLAQRLKRQYLSATNGQVGHYSSCPASLWYLSRHSFLRRHNPSPYACMKEAVTVFFVHKSFTQICIQGFTFSAWNGYNS